MTTPTLRRTPLHAEHLSLGGRMVPFAGWDMPIQYTGIVDEHRAVRTAAGLFDVSHMLQADVRGPAAASLLRRALTYNVHALPIGRAHYALLCEPDGGIRDDAFVYHIADEEYLFVGNASNAEADLERLRELALPGAELYPHTDSAMLALQGPRAVEIGSGLGSPQIGALPPRGCVRGAIAGHPAFVARTGAYRARPVFPTGAYRARPPPTGAYHAPTGGSVVRRTCAGCAASADPHRPAVQSTDRGTFLAVLHPWSQEGSRLFSRRC